MRQLTSLDAQFLALETPRQYGHVGAIAVLDPAARSSPLDLASIQELIEQRLPLVPPLRWRLAEVQFNLDYPYWVDDPEEARTLVRCRSCLKYLNARYVTGVEINMKKVIAGPGANYQAIAVAPGEHYKRGTANVRKGKLASAFGRTLNEAVWGAVANLAKQRLEVKP